MAVTRCSRQCSTPSLAEPRPSARPSGERDGFLVHQLYPAKALLVIHAITVSAVLTPTTVHPDADIAPSPKPYPASQTRWRIPAQGAVRLTNLG